MRAFAEALFPTPLSPSGRESYPAPLTMTTPLSPSGYPLDHIGIAVRDLEEAISSYCDAFHYTVGVREEVPSQGVEVAFLGGPTMIELLAPITPDSSLERFLARRGTGLHHLCYRVPDIERALAELIGLGHSPVDLQPRPGAHGTRVAFLYPKSFSGVLTELCEYPSPV